ncbi:MAG: 4-hydroxy-3-methylbut-2-enyl diphosphate reductase [Flavobacteriales bacterium]|mgnify:CR=1 FL=1|nr:4-hydroxy-3-methylbut-2-enyl diphosphate reductase [Flavobacteriales bacterium]|tara:strand:+ start:16545 stop:17417 length:873 start_codon:yes stop_codon:yes gene_type:complete
MKITIDTHSGFCFGVVYAIEMAEDILRNEDSLYCLGDIVHNNKEVERLNALGLKVINHNDLHYLKDCKVLIRAHGEPPSTYELALKNNIQLLDASCPVVLKLQNQIKGGYEQIKQINGQVIIFGKEGHAEVVGLLGQTNNNAIIVASVKDLDKIDFTKSIYIYSQTTKSPKAYQEITLEIEKRVKMTANTNIKYIVNDTLCRQVSGREPQLKRFSNINDVIIFVSGRKSSNGKMLYQSCKDENHNSYFISDVDELRSDWFIGANSVGICGATSTPRWLMESVEEAIQKIA